MPLLFTGGGIPPITLTDDLNRADAATLGANYVALGTSMTVATNRAQAGSPALNTATIYGSRHITALNTDRFEVTCDIVAPTAGADPANQFTGLILRCNAAGSLWIEVDVSNTKLWIYTRAGSGGTATARGTSGSGGATISTPTSLRVFVDGNQYAAYINGSGTAAATWSDSTNVVPADSTTRYTGMTGSAGNNFGAITRGYGIDNWVARDI